MEIIQPQLPGPHKRQSDIEVIHFQGIKIAPLVSVRQSQENMQRRHRCWQMHVTQTFEQQLNSVILW